MSTLKQYVSFEYILFTVMVRGGFKYQVEVKKMKVKIEILGLAVFIQEEAW